MNTPDKNISRRNLFKPERPEGDGAGRNSESYTNREFFAGNSSGASKDEVRSPGEYSRRFFIQAVSATAATLRWESTRLKSKFAHMIFYDGHVYGLDDGVMTCLDLETGERLWKKGRIGHGQMLLVGDLLLVMQEDGQLLLVQPDPADLVELTRFQVFDGKTWNVPTLVGNLLLARNDAEAAAYELPVE